MPELKTKPCRVCNVDQDIKNYYKNDNYKDGHVNICTSCQRNYHIERKANKPAKPVDWFIWD